MARPCTVCASMDRSEIDRRLSFQVVNVSQLAREYGLSRDAMAAHRKNHLPEFLPAFQARASALTLDVLQAEAQRLYTVTLDALARAEAGVLQRVEIVDPETGDVTYEHRPVVSITGVARMIREARAGLGQLTALAADRGDTEGRPSTGEDAQLGAAIRAQLARVVARQSAPRLEAGRADDVHDVDALDDLDRVGGDATSDGPNAPGGSGRAAGGAPGGVVIPLDTAKAAETPSQNMHDDAETPEPMQDEVPLLSDEQLRTAAAAIGITAESFLASIRQARTQLVRHPEWTGNIAASEDERRAEGYGAVPISDNRIEPDTRITPVQ